MAQIAGAQNERVFSIQRWLGLNQNPDGDTKLKMGEAAAMENWRVTRDGNLQKRPGVAEVLHISTDSTDGNGDPVYEAMHAVWTGFVGGQEVVMVICGKTLYSCWDDSLGFSATAVKTFDNEPESPHMFGFSGKLYVIADGDYWEWDGTTFSQVRGYVPLVAVAIPPNGGGETLEQVNKLTVRRRVWLSPDGVGTTFQLPEKDLYAITGAVKTSDGTTTVPIASSSLADGTVTFALADVPEGTNTIEVSYQSKKGDRAKVTGMRFSEFYNGSQDTRVFLYGDGTADAIYSDLDYDGVPRADYFPDLNQIRIGVENTPITGMIRQYSRLVAFKSDSTWSVSFGQITTAQGDSIPGFYATPINRAIGNEAMGSVQLVLNNPVTLFGQDLYEWRAGSYGNLTNDERNAKRISDRVYSTLHDMVPDGDAWERFYAIRTFDDNYHQEYYVFDQNGKALVWNYAADAWYSYEDFRLDFPFTFRGELYNCAAGGIHHVSTDYAFDKWASEDAKPIVCRWVSGSMAFGADYQRKYAAMIWVAIKPETHGEVWVTVQTDKSSSYREKVVASQLFGFDAVDFADFTFELNRKPQMKRLKIKAKKFVFYNLVLESNGPDGEDGFGCGATVTGVDIRVRFTGFAK